MQPETKAERLAREDADWRAEKLALEIDSRKRRLRDRIARVDGRLAGLRPQLDALRTLHGRFSAGLATIDAAGPPVGASERESRQRARQELRELIRQIEQGSGAMAEGDLAARLLALGVAHDNRSLPVIEQQVATLAAERAGLQAQLDAM
jgi:chromosome segregation ATPase